MAVPVLWSSLPNTRAIMMLAVARPCPWASSAVAPAALLPLARDWFSRELAKLR